MDGPGCVCASTATVALTGQLVTPLREMSGFSHQVLVVSICLALRATTALVLLPSHMHSAWGAICLLLFASMGRNGTVIFLTDYVVAMEEDYEVSASLPETCWRFCLQWPQTLQRLCLLANSSENERRMMWSLLLFPPYSFNCHTGWHATQGSSNFAKAEMSAASQSNLCFSLSPHAGMQQG